MKPTSRYKATVTRKQKQRAASQAAKILSSLSFFVPAQKPVPAGPNIAMYRNPSQETH